MQGPSTLRRKNAAQRFIPPVILALFTLIFFFRILSGEEVFQFRDLFFFHYPLRHYWISNLLDHGWWPFFNTALNNGQPILGNPNYAVFYPGNFLFLFLPFNTAWNLFFLLHVYWGALGLYAFARILGAGRTPALCGSIVFAYGGPFISGITYQNLLVTGSWIPWIGAFWLLAWKRKSYWTPIAILSLSLQFLAGEPTVQLVTLIVVAGGWLIVSARDETNRLRKTLRGIGMIASSMLICGVQLLPALLWLPHSARGGGLEFRASAAYWSMHPARLIEIIAPHFYGNPMEDLFASFWGGNYSDAGFPYILKLYAGILPILLIAPSLKKKKWPAVFAVGFLILSMGHHLPLYETFFHAPLLQMIRYPEKFLLFFLFGAALCTVMGLEALKDLRNTKGSFVSAAILIILFLIAVRFPWTRELTASQIESQQKALLHGAILCAVGIGVLVLYTRERYHRSISIALPAILFLDIASFTIDIPKTYPVDSEPRILKVLPQLKENPLLHLGEDQTDLYFSGWMLPQRNMREALHPLTGLTWGLSYGATADIDRMGWRWSTGRQSWIHRNFSKPEVFAVIRSAGIYRVLSLRPLDSPELEKEAALQLSGKQDLHVYRLKQTAPAMVRVAEGQATAQWVEEAPHRIKIDVEAKTPAKILVARNAVPGWRAKENESPVAIQAGNERWIEFNVPDGKHRIVLDYLPPGLRAGFLLSLTGLLLTLILWRLVKLH